MNTAKDLAYETVTHPPVIINKYWHSWNHETNQYDTTYIKAEGDSAYQVWLDAGNVGTVEDYLADIKGDPFLYSDFTPEQIATLQQPATAAIASIEAVELSVEQAEALRVQAEIDRQTNTATAIQNANNAATNANTKAGLADTAANNANTKAGLADTAANNANTKAGLANDAATLANTKAGLADEAATNADNARLAIAGELALKLDKSAVKQTTGASETDVMSQKAVTDEIALKANHGYATNPKTLKEVEDNVFIPLQMPAFYVYDPAKFRVQSIKSTHKLSGNFTHIKKYNARISAVGSRFFIIKTADAKYSISFYNSGYTTKIIIINNGVTIYDLSQASSTWWPNQDVIIQRTIVDFDNEKISISYGVTNFEVSVAGLRVMKNIEFTDIELGINSYNSPCAYSMLIQGIPASDVDGTKMIQYLNTPSTSNLVNALAPKFNLSNTIFNFANGKLTFDYSILSNLSTTGNTYTQHHYDINRMFNISNIDTSQQEILVRYSFAIDVENASVYFKQVTTTLFNRIRLVNRDTLAVIDITTNLSNPFEVPIGKWNMVVSTVAKRQYEFGLLLGWGGCNSGAVMTIYQEHRIDPVSVVLSAYPRLANFQKAWCPYSKQFTSEINAAFSNDII